jgi:DNA gyrase subunit B
MPVDINHKSNRTGIDMIFSILHAGGKFDGSNYKASSGLHGVGASVVNALSEYLVARVKRNNKLYQVRYEIGLHPETAVEPHAELQIIGDAQGTGTVVEFKPDASIFLEGVEFDYDIVRNRLKQLSYLNPNIRLNLIDSRLSHPRSESFCTEGGIAEYIKDLNANKNPIGKILYFNYDYIQPKKEGYIEKEYTINVQVALQYNDSSNEPFILSFANGVNTVDGGHHVYGFESQLTRIINIYTDEHNLREKNKLKKDDRFEGADVKEGLVAIVYVKHPDPQFEGQTKAKLGSADARTAVSGAMTQEFTRFLDNNPQDANLIVNKCIQALRRRRMVSKINLSDPLDNLGFASKLADCRSKDPSQSELYIVEGDSAGGSAKQGRDSRYQAILPLRGKVLNVEKVDWGRALKNNEINSLMTAIGTGVSDKFDINKARYHKIVIMTDADVDGAHIRILLLTFFFRKLIGLIEHGYIYFAQPPLYKVQQGKQIRYAYQEEQLEQYKKELGGKPQIQRYKGLGEMDASQLWDTTMDPKTRTLLQVTMEDAVLADDIFTKLMGEDVPPRKDFIVENAKYVHDLDV